MNQLDYDQRMKSRKKETQVMYATPIDHRASLARGMASKYEDSL